MDPQAEITALGEQLKAQITDPAKQELVATIAADMAAVTAKAMAGQNVDNDLAHLKAQTLNLAASEQAIAANTFEQWAFAFVHKLVLAGLTA